MMSVSAVPLSSGREETSRIEQLIFLEANLSMGSFSYRSVVI